MEKKIKFSLKFGKNCPKEENENKDEKNKKTKIEELGKEVNIGELGINVENNDKNQTENNYKIPENNDTITDNTEKMNKNDEKSEKSENIQPFESSNIEKSEKCSKKRYEKYEEERKKSLLKEMFEDHDADEHTVMKNVLSESIDTHYEGFSVDSCTYTKNSQIDQTLFDYDGYLEKTKPDKDYNAKDPVRLGFIEPKFQKPNEYGLAKPNRVQQKDLEPKYLKTLINVAKRRELEKEIYEEKKLKRERDEEKNKYGDTEVFITKAYKKKLEEREKLQNEIVEKNIKDQKSSVINKKDLTDFHSYLLKSGKGSRLGGSQI